MRALAMTGFDAAPTLTDLEVPEPADGEIRVRVRAASVNGFDLAVAAGYTRDYMEHRFPLVLGKDFAGEVDALGGDVTGYAVGDRVFGSVAKPYVGHGSFAEYVTVPTTVGLTPCPRASRSPMLPRSAWPAPRRTASSTRPPPARSDDARRRRNRRGRNQVVQLAAAAGARVIATAHTDAERDLVTQLGARATVEHTGDLAFQVRAIAPDRVHVLAHLAGDPGVVELVRDGGRFLSTLLPTPDQQPSQTVTVIPVYANPTREVLDASATVWPAAIRL